MTTGELALQQYKNDILKRSAAPAYLNANGFVNVMANRMFQSADPQFVQFQYACTLSECYLLIVMIYASAHFINLCGIWSFQWWITLFIAVHLNTEAKKRFLFVILFFLLKILHMWCFIHVVKCISLVDKFCQSGVSSPNTGPLRLCLGSPVLRHQVFVLLVPWRELSGLWPACSFFSPLFFLCLFALFSFYMWTWDNWGSYYMRMYAASNWMCYLSNVDVSPV